MSGSNLKSNMHDQILQLTLTSTSPLASPFSSCNFFSRFLRFFSFFSSLRLISAATSVAWDERKKSYATTTGGIHQVSLKYLNAASGSLNQFVPPQWCQGKICHHSAFDKITATTLIHFNWSCAIQCHTVSHVLWLQQFYFSQLTSFTASFMTSTFFRGTLPVS